MLIRLFRPKKPAGGAAIVTAEPAAAPQTEAQAATTAVLHNQRVKRYPFPASGPLRPPFIVPRRPHPLLPREPGHSLPPREPGHDLPPRGPGLWRRPQRIEPMHRPHLAANKLRL